MVFNDSAENNIKILKFKLKTEENFDVVFRELDINNRKSGVFFVDGLTKDDIMEKIVQYFYSLKDEKLFKDAETFSKSCVPHIEVTLEDNADNILLSVYSGMLALVIDGFEKIILLDVRSYPQREYGEPEKDKVLRGSRDSFVETLVFNTALIRRRIRNENLRMKHFQVGTVTKNDVAVCYMDNKVDKKLLDQITRKLQNAEIKSLVMNIQALAECLYKKPWYNPFPKMKYTERPDVAASSLLDGNIVIIADNAPNVMIIPTSIFDILEEADDYYFPTITGTYIRLSRYLITLFTLVITPLWLLCMQNPDKVPEFFKFVVIDEQVNIPIFWQLMILELAIDGLRLASVNVPNMLSSTLSIVGAIVLSDFAVDSGWFAKEAMLYMAFVAVATYSHPSYELGYALKFMRIILLILTAIFDIWGFIAGLVLVAVLIITNKTISGKSYLYPLIPFDSRKFFSKVIRTRLR